MFITPDGRIRRKHSGLPTYGRAIAAVALFPMLVAALSNTAEPTVAGTAGLLPFGSASTAGMLASVNPCGLFTLPAHLSYQFPIGSGSHGPPRGRTGCSVQCYLSLWTEQRGGIFLGAAE